MNRLIVWIRSIGREFTLLEAADELKRLGSTATKADRIRAAARAVLRTGCARVRSGPNGGRWSQASVWRYVTDRLLATKAIRTAMTMWDE